MTISISFTILSDILMVPTRTNMLKISSPIQLQIMDTDEAVESTTGGLDAKAEKMIQASTMIAPSRHTPAQLFIKVNAMFWVLSPAAAASGIGEIAVYIYILKNLP